MKLKIILFLVFTTVFLSGITILDSFVTKSPPPDIEKIDTVAEFVIVKIGNEFEIRGGYATPVFKDQCDVYEMITRTYFHDCVVLPPKDTTKTKRL